MRNEDGRGASWSAGAHARGASRSDLGRSGAHAGSPRPAPRHGAAHARRQPSPSPSARPTPVALDDEASPHRSSAPAESLSTLSSGQGARVTTRDNAAEAADIARDRAVQRHRERRLRGGNRPRYAEREPNPRISNRAVVMIIGAIAALVLALAVVSCVAGTAGGKRESPASTAPAEGQRQEQADPTGTVSYKGVSYAIQKQGDGRYGIVAKDASGATSLVFAVPGTPVSLILYKSVIVVPENLGDGGWDVIAYTIGGDSEAVQVSGEDGQPVVGKGTISEAVLDGSTIRVKDSAGSTTDVSLE